MMNMIIKCYSELSRIDDFPGRFDYLKMNGIVGDSTFGFDRYLNQFFYRSRKWKKVRDEVIIRDNGMDMGLDGYFIGDKIIVHHMNPLHVDELINYDSNSPYIFDPEFLISVSLRTHNAIHFGDDNLLPKGPIVRVPNDTCPWK